MEQPAAVRRPQPRRQPRIQLLLADDDAALRSLVAARACEVVDSLVVHEAEDGAEALQVALQSGAQLALVDVNMPRLGGIEIAVTLRELRPQLRLALQTVDPAAHRDRADACGVPLFDKLHLDRAFAWLERQARIVSEPHGPSRKPALACIACGYGIACSVPPHRCPMCQGEGTWGASPFRPSAAERRIA